jgi:drug/metabolite transporter (DMT)-like permease
MRKNYSGVLFMLVASLSFAIMGVFVKRLGKDFDSVQIVLFRNLVGVLFIVGSFWQKPLKIAKERRFLLLFRGFIGTISLYAFAYNLVHTPLGVAFTFYQTSTFFIAFFSYFFLKEKLNLFGWAGILVGFGGIVTIFRPDVNFFQFGNLIGLINGGFSAMAYMAVSELKKYHDTRAIVLSFMGWGIILPILSMLVGYFYYTPTLDFLLSQPKMPHFHHLFDIVCVGIAAMMGQIYATKAFGAEKAGIVSSISYSNVIFSIALGILFNRDAFPDFTTLLGMTMIIASGLLISLTKDIEENRQ